MIVKAGTLRSSMVRWKKVWQCFALAGSSALSCSQAWSESNPEYQLAPQVWQTWSRKGSRAFHHNDFAAAEQAYRQALAADKNISPMEEIDTNLNLAAALTAQHKWVEAETIIKRQLATIERLGWSDRAVNVRAHDRLRQLYAASTSPETLAQYKTFLALLDHRYGKNSVRAIAAAIDYCRQLEPRGDWSTILKLAERLDAGLAEAPPKTGSALTKLTVKSYLAAALEQSGKIERAREVLAQAGNILAGMNSRFDCSQAPLLLRLLQTSAVMRCVPIGTMVANKLLSADAQPAIQAQTHYLQGLLLEQTKPLLSRKELNKFLEWARRMEPTPLLTTQVHEVNSHLAKSFLKDREPEKALALLKSEHLDCVSGEFADLLLATAAEFGTQKRFTPAVDYIRRAAVLIDQDKCADTLNHRFNLLKVQLSLDTWQSSSGKIKTVGPEFAETTKRLLDTRAKLPPSGDDELVSQLAAHAASLLLVSGKNQECIDMVNQTDRILGVLTNPSYANCLEMRSVKAIGLCRLHRLSQAKELLMDRDMPTRSPHKWESMWFEVAYLELYQALSKQQDKTEAKAILLKGLQQLPASRLLQEANK